MLLALLAFLGGILTIVSPCILPVLPFVFARAGQSFARGTLPLLAGMGLTFAAIAALAAVGGAWAVRLNSYGRLLALLLLAAFGVALLSTRVAEWLARPLVALGNRLAGSGERPESVLPAATLGVATGLLWAPCAGPILGLILTGAALSGPSVRTTVLLLAYALGAMTSLALATLAGARIVRAFKSSLGAAEWLRRALGVAVLAGVAAIAAGWDTGVLTRLSLASTNHLEQSLLNSLRPQAAAAGGVMTATASRAGSGNGDLTAPPVEGEMPSLDGAVAWLNSAPLTKQGLRGRVVVIDFWTYSCINCLRTLPYLRAWDERYRDHGLSVIGVHTPEFAFEKDEANVQRAVHDLGIHYPVAIDNDYAIWRAFDNQYWPAHYFIDAQGRIRGHHFGEGNYDESEQLIRELLAEAGFGDLPAATSAPRAAGVEVAADEPDIQSPETYIGYERATNFVSAAPTARDRPAKYTVPRTLQLNEWSLGGTWTVSAEYALSRSPGDTIVFRFHARDLHLVLGPDAANTPVRFRVMIDGHEPGQNHGSDTDEHGNGTVHEQRLYQLIRQSGAVGDRTFTIEFLDVGVRAYAFTFG
jgi:cytochrome c biogenesis protein CcdA/thiol-disulfide isomerase/thioredoxin